MLDVGAGIEESVDELDVVVARGPVQRGLVMPGADCVGVNVSACPDEGLHYGAGVRSVPGGIRVQVQRQARVDDAVARAGSSAR